MPTTSNFGWTTPADTDLVKNGALAIRTLGNGIDTTMAELKGGTTGQVLSKTSNTDMDFTWVTTDDANAIQNAIVDAKGDLIAATANDTPARLAVGNNGESLVADSSASTGLRWQGNFAAGKNKIINGDFRINQRAFTSTSIHNTYGFDRWVLAYSTGTVTYSAQTFTAGAAPVAGYEASNFARIVTSGQTSTTGFAGLYQKIEDVRTLAGQTVTISFWAKASSGTPKVQPTLEQNFGSGGSASVVTAGTSVTISTSWARYSATVTLPSLSGKTIGTGSGTLELQLYTSLGTSYPTYGDIGVQAATIDIWGVQLEAGNTATAFQTATGTIAGELAACQRYYFRTNGTYSFGGHTLLMGLGTTQATGSIALPTQMRITPTTIDYSNLAVYTASAATAITSITMDANNNSQNAWIVCNVASGLTANTLYRLLSNAGAGYIGFSAEL